MESVHRNIGIVQQDVFLFVGTIRGANEIAVVINRRITKRETHEEFMAVDGTYKKLYSLRSGE